MFKTVKYMKSYPSKLISVKNSILMSMLSILNEIPTTGIKCTDLQVAVACSIDVGEYIEAMTNLFAISCISIDEHDIIRKIC